MRTRKLPKTVEFRGKHYDLSWEISSNMDCLEAFFSTDLRFESESSAENELYYTEGPDGIDGVDFTNLFADGTIRVRIYV